MKLPSFTPLRSRARQQGVALVIVLTVLVLVAAMLVAFLSAVKTDKQASTIANQGFQAKQAAESAVNLVISQVRDATKAKEDYDPASGDPTISQTAFVSWASQPGLIRTFDSGGNDLRVFKLYSSDALKLTASDYNPSTPAESGVGLTQADLDLALYTDLNEPAFVPVANSTTGAVEPRYPIVDPRARLTIDGSEPAATIGVGTLPAQKSIVDGFDCLKVDDPAGHKDKSGKIIPVLPLRVKWLYQLKDGGMVALGSDGMIKGASSDNPPIARMAFWTDDDSSKINVNTAGENTYWDTPSVGSRQEAGSIAGGILKETRPESLALAAAQPTAGEYQRYPGHPATTSLSPALRWLFNSSSGNNDKDFKEAIYRLAPRMAGGPESSMAATRSSYNASLSTTGIQTDKDRLFSNLDEYWFRPDRSGVDSAGISSVFSGTNGGKDTAFTSLAADALEKMRFFITANSRAPELTLFGTPRVCIWPVHEKANPADKKRSAYDNLISFCSTVAKKPFYFQRAQPWSSSYDYYNAGKGRNVELFSYLQKLTSANIPGAVFAPNTAGTFAQKYSDSGSNGSKEIDQILTEIFDYIRSTNLVDTGNPELGSPYPLALKYPLAYTPLYLTAKPPNAKLGDPTPPPPIGAGQVIPTVRKEGTKGFGRFVTLSEAGFLFVHEADDYDKTVGGVTTTVHVGYPGDPIKPANYQIVRKVGNKDITCTVSYRGIRCIFLAEHMTPSQGYPPIAEAFAYKVIPQSGNITIGLDTTSAQGLTTGINGGVVGGTVALNIFDNNSYNFINVDGNASGEGRPAVAMRGWTNSFQYSLYDTNNPNTKFAKSFEKGKSPAGGGQQAYQVFPYFSQKFWVPYIIEGLDPYATPEITGPNAKIVGNPLLTMTSVDLNYKAFPLDVAEKDILTPPTRFPGAQTDPVHDITFNIPAATFASPMRKRYSYVDPKTLDGSVTPTPANNEAYIQPTFQERVSLWIPQQSKGGNPFRNMIAPGDNGYVVASAFNGVSSRTELVPRPSIYSNSSREVHAVDAIRTVEVGGLAKGDTRLVAARYSVPKTLFEKAGGANYDVKTELFAHNLNAGSGQNSIYTPYLGAKFGTPTTSSVIYNYDLPFTLQGIRPPGVASSSVVGDFDRGISKYTDGPFINKPDEGSVKFGDPNGGIPYFVGSNGYEEVGGTYFSPNRLIASAVMFGSLPTGVFAGRPWETLLFSPLVVGTHRGGKTPMDHYLLDLFHMPVVEPYAISEPLSTAGKINLNTRLAPFGYAAGKGSNKYIVRNTGLHAVLKDMYQLTVGNVDSGSGHDGVDSNAPNHSVKYRTPIDPYLTIKYGVEERFNGGIPQRAKYFRSASEICEVDLLLNGGSSTNTQFTNSSFRGGFWSLHQLTGDNLRERPYAHLYPRLTTKSNIYTVHVRAQSIAIKSSKLDGKIEDKDVNVTGEYRGSTTIERYIDPNDPALTANVMSGIESNLQSLDKYYRFRVLGSKQFQPR